MLPLQASLTLYVPQALQWTGTYLHSRLACDWLLKWPTPKALQEAKLQTIRAFYYAHNYRRPGQVEGYLQAMAVAKPLTRDAAVITAHRLTVQMLVKQLRPPHDSIAESDRQIAPLCAKHPDAVIFDNLPGAGSILAPRPLSAFGTDRDRHPAPKDMQTNAGIAPVIERSSKLARRLAQELSGSGSSESMARCSASVPVGSGHRRLARASLGGGGNKALERVEPGGQKTLNSGWVSWVGEGLGVEGADLDEKLRELGSLDLW